MNQEKVRFKFWFKILLTIALLTLGVIHFNWLCLAVQRIYSIVFPFLMGGLIAFILNIPMRKIEQILFAKAKKPFFQKIKRPVSIVLTLLFVVLLVSVLFLTVMPQVVETAKVLPEQIKAFYYSSLEQIIALMEKYPQVTDTLMLEMQKIMELEIDWKQLLSTVTDFFINGFGGSFIKNTFSVAGKIGSGVVNAVISLIFSIYLLAQKEKLKSQGKRILSAFLNEKMYAGTMRVVTLLGTNFSNFIAGQCVEAVILGVMIMVVMLILGFDYALLIGVLVAFTALIPVVGAFVGCGVGAFLFLLQDPITALWFILIFVIIQQLEGNLIYPYVVGNSVGLPSLWILAAITVGGSLMGVGGMLFFIPLFSTGYTLLRDSVNERNSNKEWVRMAWATDFLPKSVQEMERRKKAEGMFGFLKFGKKNKNTKNATEHLQHRNEVTKTVNTSTNKTPKTVRQHRKRK